MAKVQVRDRSIWTKHIHGDAELARRLEELEAGTTIELRVAGSRGWWEKMRCGAAGSQTPGFKPLGEAKEQWGELFRQHRGELVELTFERPSGSPSPNSPPPAPSWATATDTEREAAWAAFKALTRAGWRSEIDSTERAELHER
jgi:hypothetical protein